MIKRKYAALLALVLIGVGIGSLILYREGFLFPHRKKITDFASLTDNLQAAGATVRPSGELPFPFFSVKAQVIIVNEEHPVMVFEYADEASADAEAALISPDGSSIGTAKPAWGSTPHFYKAGRLIVLYVGDNNNMIELLESLLGSQFAGG